MSKNILQKKEVDALLNRPYDMPVKRGIRRCALIAKTYLSAGAALHLRGNSFVFTLPAGEAVLHFDPWETTSSGNCVLTENRFNQKTGESFLTHQLIPATPQLGRPLEGEHGWERRENQLLFDALIDLLTPYIK